MKIRELTRLSGSTLVPAWPPRWVASFPPVDTMPAPDEGVLEFVMVSSRRTILILTMRFDARQYTGVLSWDAPPSLAAVENLLGANLGTEIRAIGDLDIID